MPLPAAKGAKRTTNIRANPSPSAPTKTSPSLPAYGHAGADPISWLRSLSATRRSQRKTPPTNPIMSPVRTLAMAILITRRFIGCREATLTLSTRSIPSRCHRRPQLSSRGLRLGLRFFKDTVVLAHYSCAQSDVTWQRPSFSHLAFTLNNPVNTFTAGYSSGCKCPYTISRLLCLARDRVRLRRRAGGELLFCFG